MVIRTEYLKLDELYCRNFFISIIEYFYVCIYFMNKPIYKNKTILNLYTLYIYRLITIGYTSFNHTFSIIYLSVQSAAGCVSLFKKFINVFYSFFTLVFFFYHF